MIYHSSAGQTINTGIPASAGLWHDVVLTHQYAASLTRFYVDGVLQGTTPEQLAPVRFVLGGRGNAKPRPGSPSQADFENWFVHRSVLIAEQVAALHQGILQQGSLEVYAPLDDGAFVPGGAAANLAQSSSTVAINGTNLLSLPSEHLLFTDGILVLNFNNLSNGLFEVQRSATVGFSNYTVMLVTNAAPNGTITCLETNPPAGSEFYRVRPH